MSEYLSAHLSLIAGTELNLWINIVAGVGLELAELIWIRNEYVSCKDILINVAGAAIGSIVALAIAAWLGNSGRIRLALAILTLGAAAAFLAAPSVATVITTVERIAREEEAQ